MHKRISTSKSYHYAVPKTVIKENPKAFGEEKKIKSNYQKICIYITVTGTDDSFTLRWLQQYEL